MVDQNTSHLTEDVLASVDEAQDLLDEVACAPSTGVAPEYSLQITSDKVTVVLDCPDPLASLEIHVQQILLDFVKLEIPVFPDAEQLTSILQNISRPGCHLYQSPIIMGQKDIPSQDGKLVWSREYFNEGWNVDEESGVIDFWEKLENRSVTEGEMMVKMFHPVEGESGLNVFGIEIPVAKPAKVKLRCGKGVRTEEVEDGVLFISNVNGRVRLADGTVSVDDVYMIKGNVSLATGNIRHTGAVQIQGDVETGATIDADGDIMIKGLVEPCHIRCGGTLTVAGGLVGSKDFTIEVEGEFNARYVNEAVMRVGGNVTVTNEISHADIKCLGIVTVPKGRIAGGRIQALKGIRVAEAGASGSTQTNLIAGVDYALEEQLEIHNAKIKKMEEAQEKIQKALKTIAAKNGALDPSEAQVLNALVTKSKQLGQTIADEYAHVRTITTESRRHAVFEVVMMQVLWSGTRIQLGEFKLVVKSSIQKPRIAKLLQTRVRILPLGDGNMPDD